MVGILSFFLTGGLILFSSCIFSSSLLASLLRSSEIVLRDFFMCDLWVDEDAEVSVAEICTIGAFINFPTEFTDLVSL